MLQRLHVHFQALYLYFFSRLNSQLLNTPVLSQLTQCVFFSSLTLAFIPDFPLVQQGQITFPTDGVSYIHFHSRICSHMLCFIGRTIYYLLIFLSAPQEMQCPAWGLCSLPESHTDKRRQGNGCSLPLAEEYQPICVSAAAQFQEKW